MSSNSETKDRPYRPRIQPAMLTKMDVDAVLFAKKIHGGIKKCTDHYKLGSQRVKNIWNAEYPYSHANSNGSPNIPPWFTPENTTRHENNKDTEVKSMEDSKPDINEKQKRKEANMRRVIREEIKKLVNSEY